ncbi:phosphocarrier protein HPr [Candidatus Nitrosoglobus terrae]|uniref:Phosphocarrier protein HPr n=1 Tax=Candidatus Nitrosoglobus terrae TaxID=1630141 RepID=A0A1Q2SPD1_9GAMM|nr:HPr family phosphocarrier protein [Candidatus Nitrosoglobus terrae]BAW80998.1 phosphocarrier protein HPr [Candidatus Nitrosoglobus terrae]
MIRGEVIILNKLGLHARAAAKFVTLASQFTSEIRIQHKTKEANGKSIMGIMMLAASQGSHLCITASGSDEIAALQQLEALINERFGEHE